VFGNQVQLQQVILNLVMNAIEAMSSMETRVLRIASSGTSASHPFERTSGECQAKSRFTLGKVKASPDDGASRRAMH
jgi:hypothetical protein